MAQRHHKKRQEPSENLLGELIALRTFVDNINAAPDLAMRNGVYQGLDKKKVFCTKIDGIVYGYQLEDHGVFMRRKIFIQTPGYQLAEIPEDQKDVKVTAAFMAMLDKGQSDPSIEMIAPDALLVTQDFMPLVLTRVNN